MKTHKMIIPHFPKNIAVTIGTIFCLSITTMATPSVAADQKPESPFAKDHKFLQDIQNKLTKGGGITDRIITIQVSQDKRRMLTATPNSLNFSYGFLQHMTSVNHLIATMAHMTAHISLDYLDTPPVPEDMKEKKSSVSDYLKSAVRPQFPDENNIPQATGAFHTKGANIIERPDYQNKSYDLSINKSDMIAIDHQLDVDKTTGKILKHAGFCPSDYSRLLHYFYENPQKITGNKHFALEATEWQRIDANDQRAKPDTVCNPDQQALINAYVPAFNQFMTQIKQNLLKQSLQKK